MLNFDQIDPDFNVTCWFLRPLNDLEVNLIQLWLYLHPPFWRFRQIWSLLGIFSGKIPRNPYPVTKQFFPGYQVYLSQVTSFIAPPGYYVGILPVFGNPWRFPKRSRQKSWRTKFPEMEVDIFIDLKKNGWAFNNNTGREKTEGEKGGEKTQNSTKFKFFSFFGP